MDRRSVLVRAVTSLGAILILAAGCSDQSPTEASLRPQVAVLSKAHRPGVTSRIIGPEGGKLEAGIVSIDFPAGALATPTRISAEVDGQHLAVTLQPHGLVFPESARPILSFDVEGVTLPRGTSIFYLDAGGQVLERIHSEAKSITVYGSLNHFSQYAVAVD